MIVGDFRFFDFKNIVTDDTAIVAVIYIDKFCISIDIGGLHAYLPSEIMGVDII